MWEGSPASLAPALGEVATTHVSCKYTELSKDPIDVSAAVANNTLLQALTRLQRNLCFPQKLMEKALLELHKSNDFPLTDSEVPDWTVTMAKRMQVVAHAAKRSGSSRAQH